MSKVYSGAKVAFDPGPVKEGQYGKFQVVKIKHDDLPANDRGYKEAVIYASPGSPETALRKGMTVTLVIDDKGRASIAGGPVPQEAQVNGQNGATPTGVTSAMPPHPGELDAEGRKRLAAAVEAWSGVYVHARKCLIEKDVALPEESCHAAAVTILIEMMRTNR